MLVELEKLCVSISTSIFGNLFVSVEEDYLLTEQQEQEIKKELVSVMVIIILIIQEQNLGASMQK